MGMLINIIYKILLYCGDEIMEKFIFKFLI